MQSAHIFEEFWMARAAAISVRVEPSVKKAAEQAASDDGRTLSQLMERLLVAYLRKEGYLKK